MPKIQQIQTKLFDLSWALLVLLLPITSFPPIVKLVGSDVIGYPSGLLLVVLLVFWYLPLIFNGGKLNRQQLPLIAFVLLAILSTVFSTFQSIPAFKGNSIVREELQSILTLMIGVTTLFVTSKWTQEPGRLQKTMRFLNWSGFFVIFVSFVEAASWQIYAGYPPIIDRLHNYITTGVLPAGRVTGLALEPSFYAHQLNCLYIPLWFSATVQKYSTYRKRVLGITFENVLFVLSVAALFMTFSRVGYISFFMMLGVFFLRLNRKLVDWLLPFITSKLKVFQDEKTETLGKRTKIRRRFRVGLIILLIVLYGVLLVGSVLIFVRIDPRMETFFKIDFQENQWLYHYLGRMDLGPRISFWMAGWNVFKQHPLFGVGLGNSGFFFMDALPEYSWTFPEVRALMWHSSTVLNPKNLWSRLLAETGILGFSAFIIWLLTMWKTGKELLKKNSPLLKQMGLMGIFVVVALLVEGFSVDSFALPYYWLSFGLVLSAFRQSQGISKPNRG